MRLFWKSSADTGPAAMLRDTSGLAMIEFAFAAPLLLLMGLGGIELASYAAAHMRVSQTAMQLADNASRIGDRNPLAAERIFEGDINDLLVGAEIQAGSRIDLFENGRVIISSLEQNDDGGQTIRWQRCMGRMRVDSSYGAAGTGRNGSSFPGMGAEGSEITAPPDGAVMYAEVMVDYRPVVAAQMITEFLGDLEIRSEAAFTVRGTRNLEEGVAPTAGETRASCNRYEAMS